MTSEAPVSPATEHAPASQVLRALADGHSGETISVGQIMEALGDRGFGLLMIIFSLPNLIPSPGVGEFFGIPLFILGLQMLRGRKAPWLPASIARRTISHRMLVRIVNAVEPRLRWVESVLRPRMTFLFSTKMDRVFGAFVALCAISVMIPFPGTNFPVAIATVLMSLAVMEEDGIALMIGAAIGLAGLAYTVLVVGGLAWIAGAAAVKLLIG